MLSAKYVKDKREELQIVGILYFEECEKLKVEEEATVGIVVATTIIKAVEKVNCPLSPTLAKRHTWFVVDDTLTAN